MTGEAIGPRVNLLLLFCKMVMLSNYLLNSYLMPKDLIYLVSGDVYT